MKRNRAGKVIGRVLIAAIISAMAAGCGGTEGDAGSEVGTEVVTDSDQGNASGQSDQGNAPGQSEQETAGQSDQGEEVWAAPEQESGNGVCGYPEEEYSSTADMAACDGGAFDYGYHSGYEEYESSEEYNQIEESGFLSAAEQPLSTFSADVDTASYSNVRRMIQDGYPLSWIPKDAVRIEELLNYFSYDYDEPGDGEPFGINMEIAECPWNQDSYLLMAGLQTEAVDFSDAASSNLVFLIDVSGSMYDSDKLPLLQQSFTMLTENLTSKDRVSIVTYAGEDRVVLQGVRGNDTQTIADALNSLTAGGSTNGSAGIVTAYNLAETYYIEGGNNRVLLATDGDLNVGLTTQEQLADLIGSEKLSGVYLSVLGFGTGNIKDSNMETLADQGNGNYSYIDSLTEAKKVLVKELGATLVTVAKDVKLQMEFNPSVVDSYRLIGYENRALADEDFADDAKDAGEIGSGHSVTVLYEIQLTDNAAGRGEADGKHGIEAVKAWGRLHVRFKAPDSEESSQLDYSFGQAELTQSPSQDFRFASMVAEFAMLLRGSEYAGNASFRGIISELSEMNLTKDEYKSEFAELVNQLMRNTEEQRMY